MHLAHPVIDDEFMKVDNCENADPVRMLPKKTLTTTK